MNKKINSDQIIRWELSYVRKNAYQTRSVLWRGQLEFEPHFLQAVQVHLLVLLLRVLNVTLRRTVHLFWPIVSIVLNRHLLLRYHTRHTRLLLVLWFLCNVTLALIMLITELRFLWLLQIRTRSIIWKIHHLVLFIMMILPRGFIHLQLIFTTWFLSHSYLVFV